MEFDRKFHFIWSHFISQISGSNFIHSFVRSIISFDLIWFQLISFQFSSFPHLFGSDFIHSISLSHFISLQFLTHSTAISFIHITSFPQIFGNHFLHLFNHLISFHFILFYFMPFHFMSSHIGWWESKCPRNEQKPTLEINCGKRFTLYHNSRYPHLVDKFDWSKLRRSVPILRLGTSGEWSTPIQKECPTSTFIHIIIFMNSQWIELAKALIYSYSHSHSTSCSNHDHTHWCVFIPTTTPDLLDWWTNFSSAKWHALLKQTNLFEMTVWSEKKFIQWYAVSEIIWSDRLNW
jgi:hypothetical protein